MPDKDVYERDMADLARERDQAMEDYEDLRARYNVVSRDNIELCRIVFSRAKESDRIMWKLAISALSGIAIGMIFMALIK